MDDLSFELNLIQLFDGDEEMAKLFVILYKEERNTLESTILGLRDKQYANAQELKRVLQSCQQHNIPMDAKKLFQLINWIGVTSGNVPFATVLHVLEKFFRLGKTYDQNAEANAERERKEEAHQQQVAAINAARKKKRT